MMDDEKVSVNLQQIENGYLIERRWCEKTKGEKGMMNHEYKEERYFMNSLPPLLTKMFSKGKNMSDFGGKAPSGEDDYDVAKKDFIKSKSEEPKESEEE